jgi:hypothetical protein
MVQKLRAAGYKVLVTATTATAAERLSIPGADTIDSVMHLLPNSLLIAFAKDHPKYKAWQKQAW